MDILRRSYAYGTSPLTPSLSAPSNAFLFGSNISRSLSPLLHGILFRSVNANVSYSLCQTTENTTFLERLNDSQTIGASITMPNKTTFGSLLEDLTDEARGIGAVNTAFARLDSTGKRRWIGTNTDCVGIREAILQSDSGRSVIARGKPVMVIGGGGAARSAIYAMWKWFGPSEIYVINRLKAEVDEIIDFFTRNMSGIQLRYVSDVSMAEVLPTPAIVIGTIPDYPPSNEGELTCWNICQQMIERPASGLLMDMCYMPSTETRLVEIASKAGWNLIRGTEVLVRVCVAQQILWLEREPSERGVREAVKAITVPQDAAKL